METLQTDPNSADMDYMYLIYAMFSRTGRKLLMVDEAFLLIKDVGGCLWQAAETLDAGVEPQRWFYTFATLLMNSLKVCGLPAPSTVKMTAKAFPGRRF